MKNVDRRNVMFLAWFQLILYMVSDEILFKSKATERFWVFGPNEGTNKKKRKHQSF